METLYISQEKCSVRREGEHLQIVRSGEVLTNVPLPGLKTIVVFDSVSVTAPALDLLLRSGIDVIYQSVLGKVKGRVISAKGGGITTRLAQYSAFMDPIRRLEIAKSIVTAKIRNQMSLVKKYQYNNTSHDYDSHLAAVGGFLKLLDKAGAIDEVMGTEGVSAKYYWDCFRHLLKNPVFTQRRYRPSPDYANALLNLGYSFLSNEITTCLIAKHFDLEMGFLHSIHYGRDSLVLDIMEEFRAPFIDSWLLALLNKRQIRSEHFRLTDGDWRLTDDGFRKFCSLYHDRAPRWRNKFREQANRLKTALVKGEPYEPHTV
ncbi:MAG: CRISPR-associated endonuclease Cas1 [Peptococcaceae bacterium]|jgi:CRISPR-associated protein Cas1|nr:CRISPR-associated endonuclease Cas1 [Peptococcaceae bacterium]